MYYNIDYFLLCEYFQTVKKIVRYKLGVQFTPKFTEFKWQSQDYRTKPILIDSTYPEMVSVQGFQKLLNRNVF